MGITFEGGMNLSGGISMTGGEEGDPYFANVALLLHFDGTQSSTVFTDSSSTPKTITNIFNIVGTPGPGNVQVDTTVLKFGTGSAFFPSFNYLSAGNSSALSFETGDFTTEGWFRLASNASGNYTPLSTIKNNAYAAGGWAIRIIGDILLVTVASGGDAATVLESPPGLISNGTWYSFAVTRSGNIMRLFLNGNVVDTDTAMTNANLLVGDRLAIGTLFDNSTEQFADGNIDEVRITKGIARYTANYTPSTSAFPNS